MRRSKYIIKQSLNRLISLSRHILRFSRNNIGIVGLFILFAGTGSAIGIYRYMAYLDGFDFTVFYEAFYAYAHFQIPDSSVRGLNFFDGDHFHPILLTLVPFYFLFQSPYTLVILQATIVASSVFPVYLFIKNKFHDQTIALLGASAYSLSAGLQWMLFFDFHEILFAIPLIAWSIYFVEHRRWRWLLLVIILLALTKDELYIYIATMGLFLLVTRRNIKSGLLYLIGGVGGFLLLNKVVMPLLAGKRSYDYWSYTQYGASLGDAIKNVTLSPIENIKKIIGDLIAPDARLTLSLWFKPLFYIGAFISPYILLAVPLMLARFLSDQTTYSVFTFHYGATIAPIIFMAFIDSLDRITKLGRRLIPSIKPQGIKTFITMALVASIAIALIISVKFTSPFIIMTNKPFKSIETTKLLKSEPAIHAIVGKKSVMAPDTIAAHFANRNNVYTMRPIKQWDNPVDKIINPIPITEADYIILNAYLQLPDLTETQTERQKVLTSYLEAIQARNFTIVHNDSDTGWIVLKNEQRH
ncbi:MAG: DUF2079 domain-containing protein [bacterium]|nr:DUF2079 domain-containing protein [bacterium]